jgi:hypothetical protein
MAISMPTLGRATNNLTDRKSMWALRGAIFVVAALVVATVLLMNRPRAMNSVFSPSQVPVTAGANR